MPLLSTLQHRQLTGLGFVRGIIEDIQDLELDRSYTYSARNRTIANAEDAFFALHNDGTQLLTSDGTDLNSRNLSTAYDISSASATADATSAIPFSALPGVDISRDGKYVYVLEEITANISYRIRRGEMTVPHDISSLAWDAQASNDAFQFARPNSVRVAPGGRRCYIVGPTSVTQYILPSAYQTNTVDYNSNIDYTRNIGGAGGDRPQGITNNIVDLAWIANGSKALVLTTGHFIYEYSTTSAYTLNGASISDIYWDSFNFSLFDAQAGIWQEANQNKLYISTDTNSGSNSTIAEMSGLGAGTVATTFNSGTDFIVDNVQTDNLYLSYASPEMGQWLARTSSLYPEILDVAYSGGTFRTTTFGGSWTSSVTTGSRIRMEGLSAATHTGITDITRVTGDTFRSSSNDYTSATEFNRVITVNGATAEMGQMLQAVRAGATVTIDEPQTAQGTYTFTFAGGFTESSPGTWSASLVSDEGFNITGITRVAIALTDVVNTPIREFTVNNITSAVNGATTADEGDTLNIFLQTKGYVDGKVYPFTVTGVSDADINSNLNLAGAFSTLTDDLTGTLQVVGSSETLQVEILADAAVDGAETLTITLDDYPDVDYAVAIADTSLPPATFALSTSAPNNQISEGAGFDIFLTTTFVADNTTVAYSVTGIQSSDLDSFASGLSGSFLISGNSASLPFGIVFDSQSEPDETFTLTLAATDSAGNATGSPSISVTILANTT